MRTEMSIPVGLLSQTPMNLTGVKIRGSDGVSLILRNRGEIQLPLAFPGEFTLPNPGVDFMDERVLRP